MSHIQHIQHDVTVQEEEFSSSKEFLAVVDLIAEAHLGNNMHRQNISNSEGVRDELMPPKGW